MNDVILARMLLSIARELEGMDSVRRGQRRMAYVNPYTAIITRDIKTKAGAEFKLYEEVKVVEYTGEFPYRVKLEGAGGKKLSVPLSVAWKILKGFSKPPSLGTMNRWSMDGVAKAVDGSRVEPDGFASSGAPSWLLVMGVI